MKICNDQSDKNIYIINNYNWMPPPHRSKNLFQSFQNNKLYKLTFLENIDTTKIFISTCLQVIENFLPERDAIMD